MILPFFEEGTEGKMLCISQSYVALELADFHCILTPHFHSLDFIVATLLKFYTYYLTTATPKILQNYFSGIFWKLFFNVVKLFTDHSGFNAMNFQNPHEISLS